MTGRRRVGVALVLDPPAGDWVDGVRRAVGDASVERIGPHVTLVPPLNLRAADLDAALGRLRAAAATVPGPLRLALGPPATFLPANPVVFLEVGGDLTGLRAVRDAVFAPPLVRDLAWPWVPHVTLSDDAAPERIASILGAMDRFAVVSDVEVVTLLEERHGPAGRRWAPIADAVLGPPAVIGRGGLPLTVTSGRVPDPLAAEMLGHPPRPAGAHRALVRSAHREGALVGAGAAWLADDGGHVRVAVAEGARRCGVGSHLLAALEEGVRAAGWGCPVLHAEGPAGFYRARSDWSVPAGG